jgi:ADP-ribose pyrophosphatase
MKKNPQVIDRTLKYDGPAFKVFDYTVKVDDSHTVQRDIIERHDGVVIVPIDVQHNVYLVKEYCAGSNSFILSLPGGSIEHDRGSVEEQAIRELREETGFMPRKLIKLHFSFSHPSTSSRKSYTYLAYDLSWNPLSSSDEIIEVVKMPLEQAIISVHMDFISDVSTIGNLLMARDKLKELKF